MPLKALVDNLDNVEENHKDLYVPETGADEQETGRFVLAVESVGGVELRNTANLMKALETERGEAKKYKSELSRFDGLDPDIYKSLQEENEQLKAEDPNREEKINELAESRVESVKREANKRYESLKTEAIKNEELLKADRDRLKAGLESILVKERALQIAGKISDSPHLLAKHIEGFIQADVDGEIPSSVFVDVSGNPRLSPNDINKQMNEEEFINDLVKDSQYAPLIRSSTTPGGGAPTNRGNLPPNLNGKYDPTKSENERLAALKEAHKLRVSG